jgi:aspartate racemase
VADPDRLPKAKTVGIIGGIALASTIEYYRSIVALYRERTRDGSYPPLLIDSIDLQKVLDLVGRRKLADLADYVLDELTRLARAGAEFGVVASNTPHIVFDDLERRSPIPLISIVQATCRAADKLGVRRVGLVGTRFTMEASFYPEVFSRAGITVVLPDPDEQDYIHERYMSELVEGVFRAETRDRLLAIADRLTEREGIHALILGGTELPLILRDAAHRRIPYLDTTRIHVEEVVARMLSEDAS